MILTQMPQAPEAQQNVQMMSALRLNFYVIRWKNGLLLDAKDFKPIDE